MNNKNSKLNKFTSLFLSLAFVLTSFGALNFSAFEAKADEGEHFLMTYFTGNLQTEQQIRMAVSNDGINFKPLNGGNAILQEKSTDTNNYDGYTYTDGVRDPYIFKGADDYYYCIATDLEATAYGFWGNQSQMVIWRSRDLVNWSDAYYINIAQICNSTRGTSFTNSDFQRTWAPEVYYENGQYMVYFALAGGDYQATRMHYMLTDDLMDWTHYSAPQVLYDPGYDDIDADIIKEGNTYYMFYKDETPGRSTVCLATASEYTGPYTYVGQFETSSNTGAIEGCEVYTVGSNYYLVADRFGAAGNFAIYNMGPSLAAVAAKGSVISVSDGNPISTVEELYGFTNLTPRHGSIVHISSEEYNTLCSTYGGVTDDDIMYNFTTSYDINATGWRYETYNDSSLRDVNVMMKENGSSIKIPHDGGYATLKNTTFFVNDDDVRSMLPDDVYTVSFDYSLESAHSAPIFALGTGSGAPSEYTDYVMIFGNGDIWVRKSGENSDTWVANKALTLGVTYHYDIVSDGTNITFFRDGEQIGKIAATVDFPDSGTRYAAFGFTDGHSSSGYGYGTYSRIRFRDRAVTERELQTEFSEKLIYRRDDGTSTVNDMANVLNVSHSGDHNIVDPIVSHTAASYSLAGWVNPGDAVNANVIMGIGNNKWTPSPAGRYLAVREDGMILFNYCSGSNSGGNWSEHFVDISGAFTLSANTWSYIQINIVPISANQVKLCVWKDGVSTYSNDITLITKIDGNNQTGNDYSYGMLGMLQLPTNYVFLGNMGVPSWWQAENDTSYVKDVRFYAQALDPANLYQEAVDNRDAAVARDYVRSNLENYDVTASENKATRNAYHYTNVAKGGFNNVLACSYNDTVHKGVAAQNNIYYDFYWPNNIVLMYDGVNTPALPVTAVSQVNASRTTRTLQTIFVNQSSNSNFHNAHYWTGYVDNDNTAWPGATKPYNYDDGIINQNGQLANYTYIGYGDGAQYDYTYTFDNRNTPRYFWNKLNYTGSGNTSSFYEHYTSIPYRAWDGSARDITDVNHNIYVVNYKPIYDILKSSNATKVPNHSNYTLKALYNEVKDNEANYTDDSLNQFYLAAYKVLTSNPVEYSESDYQADFANTVEAAASEIKEAKEAFDAINLVERADYSSLDEAFENGESRIEALSSSDTAEYSEASVNALIQALNNAKNNATLSADVRKNVKKSDAQSEINSQTEAINNALGNLTADKAVDTSAFEEIIESITKTDNDIYDFSNAVSPEAMVETLSASVIGADKTYTGADNNTYTVKTVNNETDQATVNSSTSNGLSYLTTHIRRYTITVNDNVKSVAFALNGSDETIDETHYSSTYNNTAVFDSENEDTAWYMEYTSETTSRSKQYQSEGSVYTTKVIGDMKVVAETRSEATPHKISIIRDYQNGKHPTQQINYVADNEAYSLPEAAQILNYNFVGYYINNSKVEDASITVTGDVEITARYEAKSSDNYSVTVKSTNGETLYSSETDVYNTKVTVSDENAYGYVEKIAGTNEYRPFFKGSELTFYVTESTEIKAVATAAEFALTLPSINIRQSNAKVEVVNSKNKVYFNGQLVPDSSEYNTVLEYGFLVGVPSGKTPSESELVLENSGTQSEYRIIRAKSTKLVGANQFSIVINGISGNIRYRGYVTYQVGGQNGKIVTVYTDSKTQTID